MSQAPDSVPDIFEDDENTICRHCEKPMWQHCDAITDARSEGHREGIEAAIKAIEARKPQNPRHDWTDFASIRNEMAEGIIDELRALGGEGTKP